MHAATFVVVLQNGGDLAGLAELLDEDLIELEQAGDHSDGHRIDCALLFSVEQVLHLWDKVVVDESDDLSGG